MGTSQNLDAQQVLLADGSLHPGGLWRLGGYAAETLVHHRLSRPDAAFPHAIMKVAQVAVTPEGNIYFSSGLDCYVMHLLDGRHEIVAFPEINGQIRDIACTSEEHTVYYSVVPTPQDGAPLADGVIYRRDIWEGSPTAVATIRQSDVGGNWWGTFTIRDGVIYLATTEESSRIMLITNGSIQPFAIANGNRIAGISVNQEGKFHFACGDGRVFATDDFTTVSVVHESPRGLTDVTFQLSRE